MAQQEYIKREKGSTDRYNKVPFIIAMIDSNGTLQTIPFPPQEGVITQEQIYGVELMINPQSLSSNLSKMIGRTQTMTAFVEDHWGEELDTITFQGFTAAFVTGGQDIYNIRSSQGSTTPTNAYLLNTSTRSELYGVIGVPGPQNGKGSGVKDDEIGITTSKRRQSVSFRQFKRLIDIIRINGCFFDTFGRVSKRYYIMLSYGNVAYRGFFESIDISESATDPFRFQYTVTFKSEQTIYSYVNRGKTLNNTVTTNRLTAEKTFAEQFGGNF